MFKTPSWLVWGYTKWGGSWVLLSSALATAVRGCRGALMSCIMGVRRDAGMEGDRGGESWGGRGVPKPDPCPALRFAVLLRLWAKVNVEPPAACILHIWYRRTSRDRINRQQIVFLLLVPLHFAIKLRQMKRACCARWYCERRGKHEEGRRPTVMVT